MLFIVGDSDGVGDDGDEDEGEEEEPEDADEALTKAVEGEEGEEEEKQAGDEEFIDKEHEYQFCLESNFMGEGEQEDTKSIAEHDSKGEKGMNFSTCSHAFYVVFQ